jgi:hypothetical protein
VDVLARFCAEAVNVERGYICAVSVERAGAEPERRLKFCVKLATPVREAQDSRAASLNLLTRLSELERHAVNELGFGVMADRALAAWEANALRIYPF